MCAERNLCRPTLCRSGGSCPAVLGRFTWPRHSPSLRVLGLPNVGMGPSSPYIPVTPVEMSCWCGELGVHMESVSRKCYIKQFQKRDKHRKIILILSLKQIKSISYVITLRFKRGEANHSSSCLCYKKLALCIPG